MYSFFGNSFLSSQSPQFVRIIYHLTKPLEFTCNASLIIPPVFKTSTLNELSVSQEEQNYSPKYVFLKPYCALKGKKSYVQGLDVYVYAYIQLSCFRSTNTALNCNCELHKFYCQLP